MWRPSPAEVVRRENAVKEPVKKQPLLGLLMVLCAQIINTSAKTRVRQQKANYPGNYPRLRDQQKRGKKKLV